MSLFLVAESVWDGVHCSQCICRMLGAGAAGLQTLSISSAPQDL